jgi:dihydroflavonol-4-reductase
MQKILVVGGTGFLGQHLVREKSKQKDVTIKVLARKKRKNLFEAKNVEYVFGVNIANIQTIPPFEGTYIVYNLAGMISFHQKDRTKLLNVNNKGTLNILKICEKAKIKKLIHISSTAALGHSTNIITEETYFPWFKNKKLVYSYSKHKPERTILNSPIPSIIVYPPLLLGPGEKINLKKIVDLIKKKSKLAPPGKNSILDVRDLVRALLLLEKKGEINQKYIVTGKNYSFKKLLDLVAIQLNKKGPKFVLPSIFEKPIAYLALIIEQIYPNFPIPYENLTLAFKKRIHDSSKIRKLGWEPRFTLQETIRDSMDN